ncbi:MULTISPECIES: NAD(P)/FAD-dependent oxidoreductase [Pseudomonas]|uniref:FAD-dependent oxidoreductase n=1 Tax=Pseudomonas auratipiscis TaxID=3115853 RepID=A0AB35X0Z3_9PSED|nr:MULTISPECIES: FAD-dependent oxidoreductase [unclassified Pseudomonas]MEE1869324.1 FAD-dependent oxidoreductase [Pseudomonas sp. 120P]MEE1960201.1 FAD-dependent oxidoreductase [Pseudomonas sp. 119P]
MQPWRKISLWMDQLDETLTTRPALHKDLDVDVCVIGAGYTGLWTAYYLKQQAPHLNIAIVEASIAGFGASGRNGGWLMGNLLGEDRLLAASSPEQRRASFDLLHGIPDEVQRVLELEDIDCDYRKGGVLYCAARYPEQEATLRDYLKKLYKQGLTEDDYRWMNAEELATQLRISKPYGAIFNPNVATIQPAKLVRGLARAVERLGVHLYENSPVIDWQPGEVRTAQARIKCQWVVPAVEGYSVNLPPLGRYQMPVQSLLVATEPLPEQVWQKIGLSRGQAFSENSRQVTYGQRSADNRLVFGARGGYRFAGRLREDFDLTTSEIELRRYLFGELFPQLKDVAITHSWGGNLGMARRFQPHMLCDRKQHIALAGGYGGEGVGATNLAGRTLADLILERSSVLTQQPWAHPDRTLSSLAAWEPEPCRWLGYNAIIKSFVHEDQTLANPNSAPWRRRLASGVADFMEGFMR